MLRRKRTGRHAGPHLPLADRLRSIAPARTGRRPHPGVAAAAAVRRLRRPGIGVVEATLLGLVALVPQLLAQPGRVQADTKSYLYLDPGRFLSQSLSMWDPGSGLGTVTHQQIGYLWPMGPFYLLTHALGVPTWVAERLWVSALLFGAGAGVLFLCRTFRLDGPGRLVAALAYMLSPYPLQYLGRISVILLPWAGLPLMVALTARAARRGGWRDAALFGVVVATVGGINATSLLYVGIAPALWLVHAALVRECTWRRAWAAAWRIATLTVLVSLWWVAGLWVEGAYGVNVLKYTETVMATSSTSSPEEVLRGLGYWYFYGSDAFGPWAASSVPFTQDLWLLATSAAVPVLAIGAGLLTRWRQRSYFVLLVVVGTVLAVGAFPYTNPSPVGSLLRTFFTSTTAGLALRSTDRASPMVLLGLAVLLGAGLSAVARRIAERAAAAEGSGPPGPQAVPDRVPPGIDIAPTGSGFVPLGIRSAPAGTGVAPAMATAVSPEGVPSAARALPADPVGPGTPPRPPRAVPRPRRWAAPLATGVLSLLVIALVAAANPAVFDGATVADHYLMPATAPAAQRQAAAALNAVSPGTRVLAEPGQDFAQYTWGDTVDPVWPALLSSSRPFVTREQLLLGSLPTADMLYALDNPVQNDVVDPAGIAPMLRLMSVGDLLVQNDLAYTRYQTPQPATLWSMFAQTPPGLGQPTGYGPPTPNVSLLPMVNEATLAASPAAPVPSPVEVFPVTDPRPVVRAEGAASPVVVAGDASGIAAAADAGLLAGSPPIIYAGTLDTNPALRRSVLASHPTLVVTDSNKKRPFRWNTIEQDAGSTLAAGQPQPSSANNAPLDLFPAAPASAQTTAVEMGVKSVTASSYGDNVTYLPENRPASAIDGNLDTEWLTGGFYEPEGQWWQVTLQHPVTTGVIAIQQPLNTGANRSITQVTLTFDGEHPVVEHLGASSLSPSGTGQVLSFPTRTFSTLRITIDATTDGNARTDRGSAPVGFAEVGIPGVTAQRALAMPTDLLQAAGRSSLADRLLVTMTRNRVEPIPPRTQPETTITRLLTLPTARTFSLQGSATLSTLIPDDQIDRLVGRNGPVNGITAFSSGRLPGDLNAGAQAAIDGNPATAWSPGFGAAAQTGAWIQVDTPHPITFDHLNLQLVADGMHSVPTSLTISTIGSSGAAVASRHVVLPPVADGRQPGQTVTVPVHFTAITGSRIKVTVDTVRMEYTRNYYSGAPIALPIAVAELGIPGVHGSSTPARLPGTCMDNLLTIDGRSYPVRIVGSTGAALANQEVQVLPCGADDRNGITLSAGTHVIRTARGHTTSTGWSIDRLVLDSAAGGGAQPEAGTSQVVPAPTSQSPTVRLRSQGPTSVRLQVADVHAPFWLVLGQSINRGWTASVAGGPSLGTPTLVDGFANGWLVSPAQLADALHGGAATITLTFAPQHIVDVALALSLLGFVACVAVAAVPDRRWQRARWRVLRRLASPTAATVGERLGRKPAASDRPTIGLPPENDTGYPGGLPPESDTGYPGGPTRPILWWAAPATSRAALSPLRRALLVVGCGAGAAAVSQPLIGVLVAAAVAVTVLVPRGRAVLALGAVGAGVAMIVALVHGQATDPVSAGGSWAQHLGLSSPLAWAAVTVLGADAVVEIARRRADSRRSGAARTTVHRAGGVLDDALARVPWPSETPGAGDPPPPAPGGG